jgi:hypothetical protein|tara:strand:+ start:10 stop:558 length:549 start_codon:yes stop_codon:yes gene_type:complete
MNETERVQNQTTDEWINEYNGIKPFNHMTILPDGSGQITGLIAEKEFALLLIEEGITFKWCGSDKGPYDFVIKINGEIITLDVKCKKRNVKPSSQYDAHVNSYQKNYDCRIYVFSSMTDGVVTFMGWCGKKEFWDKANIVKKGEKDSGGFAEKMESGKIKYNQLRKMSDFIEIAKRNKKPPM